MTGAMDQRRWVRVVAIVVAVLIIGSVVAALTSVSGRQETGSDRASSGAAPTSADLEVLATELSSGDKQRVLGVIADIPVESADQAYAALGALEAVTFDEATLRYDEPTQAALIDAELTATDGSVSTERVVLVQREGRWLLYSTLQQPGATPIQTP